MVDAPAFRMQGRSGFESWPPWGFFGEQQRKSFKNFNFSWKLSNYFHFRGNNLNPRKNIKFFRPLAHITYFSENEYFRENMPKSQ
jgi:hypothetical protein